VSILDTAIAVKGTADGVGLSVTTAALDFTMTSTAGTKVVNQLSVPVLATVTTTPARIVFPDPVREQSRTVALLQSMVRAAMRRAQPSSSPTTIQIPLTATVPQPVLAATGISSIEIGTAFPQQTLGSGTTFEAEPAGTVAQPDGHWHACARAVQPHPREAPASPSRPASRTRSR